MSLEGTKGLTAFAIKRRSIRSRSYMLFSRNVSINSMDKSGFLVWLNWFFGTRHLTINSGTITTNTNIGSSERLVIDSSGNRQYRTPLSTDKNIVLINEKLEAV